MSSEEQKQSKKNKTKSNFDSNESENYNSNNLMLDLFDDDTLNISLEEEKPLFTKLYSSVIEKITSVKKELDPTNEFLTSFENLFKNQIDIINSCVKNNEPNYIYATNVLVAQIKIFSYFNTKYLKEYLSQSDSESSKILILISENMSNTVNKMVDIIFKLGTRSKEINKQVSDLQNKVNQFDIVMKEVNDENNILKEKNIKLKEENDLITQKLLNSNYSMNEPKNNNKSKKLNSKSPKKTNDNMLNNVDINQNKMGPGNIQNNITLAKLSLAGNRLFTIKMLKEVISSMYSSKITFDKKCLQNKQAKQTMEEFMYTFLNQKYGLKNMVIEWATNIINGIRTYSEDTEISLFGKILQNELEENCQLLIPNLKESINTIILSNLRNEYPYKNDIELNKMKNHLIKSELPPEKIQQIVEALFDEKGKEVLFDKINKEINNKKAIVMKNSKINGKYSREEINKINAQKQNECNFIHYDFLLDICLEYQIKLHIKYLKPFLKLFQSIDEDRDGVLNEEQFIELVKNLNIFGEENIDQVIDEFLNNIDPYRNNHITFSDIVDLLSKLNYDENQTILDKFCIKDNINSINNNNNNANNMNNDNNNDNKLNNNANNEENNEKNISNSKKGIKKINEDIIK